MGFNYNSILTRTVIFSFSLLIDELKQHLQRRLAHYLSLTLLLLLVVRALKVSQKASQFKFLEIGRATWQKACKS